MTLIEMKIASVGVDPRGGPLVLLRDDAMKQGLPIWIGMAEARAIALAIQGKSPPRPLTHQLVVSIIEHFRYKVKHIVVDELKEGTFTAKIVLEPSSIQPRERLKDRSVGSTMEIDCRPSDAIAIATIEGAPLLVAAGVLSAAAVRIEKDAKETDNEEFKKFLDNIKASDFKLQSPVDLPLDDEEGDDSVIE